MSNNNNINLSQFDFDAFQEDAILQLKSGQSLTGKDGVLTPLIKKILEAALEGEMESHLSDCREQGQPNRRNGKQKKIVKSGVGSFELETPRDRESSYEPEIIKKRQTVLNESLDNKILSLYALGMSYDAISEHLNDLWFNSLAMKVHRPLHKISSIDFTVWRNGESLYRNKDSRN